MRRVLRDCDAGDAERPQLSVCYYAHRRNNAAAEPAPWPINLGSVTDGGVTWQDLGAVYAVDPLYYAANRLTAQAPNLGGVTTAPYVQRTTFRQPALPLMITPIDLQPAIHMKQALADQVFRWQDDLIFDLPKDTSLRPRGYVRDTNGLEAPYPLLPGETTTLTAPLTPINRSMGNFSWFFTVAPQPGTANVYTVSVVVCYKRILTQTGGVPDGERFIPPVAGGTVTCLSPSYGGTTVTCAGDVISDPTR